MRPGISPIKKTSINETTGCKLSYYIIDAAIRFKVNYDVIAAQSGVSDTVDRLHASGQAVVQPDAARNKVPPEINMSLCQILISDMLRLRQVTRSRNLRQAVGCDQDQLQRFRHE